MIEPGTSGGREPIQVIASKSRLDRLRPAAPDRATPSTSARRLVWFEDPDGAYLAAASLKRYLDASLVSDAILIPTDRGPALKIPAAAAKLPVLRAIVVRFGGTIGPIE